MAGTRTRDGTRIFWLHIEWLGRHYLGPMDKIVILDHQRDRRAERFAVPNPRQDLDRIGLDLHPPAAAIALLPPPELVIYCIDVNRQTCRKAFDNGDQSLTVRFACGCEFEVHKKI